MEGKKLLPCFTFYPFQAFKDPGFYWNSDLLKKNTFGLEDILEESSLKMIKNASSFWIAETSSVFYGRCFTICYLEVCTNHNVFSIKVVLFPIRMYICSFKQIWSQITKGMLNTLSSRSILVQLPFLLRGNMSKRKHE
jgi:hypothetical protein